MKVHILYYDYYEDSYIQGVYSEEGKKRKNAEFLSLARKHYKILVDKLTFQLLEQKQERKPYAQEYEKICIKLREDKSSKELKELKKELSKQIKTYDSIITSLESQIHKYSSNDEIILQLYLDDQNLLWITEEVLD